MKRLTLKEAQQVVGYWMAVNKLASLIGHVPYSGDLHHIDMAVYRVSGHDLSGAIMLVYDARRPIPVMDTDYMVGADLIPAP